MTGESRNTFTNTIKKYPKQLINNYCSYTKTQVLIVIANLFITRYFVCLMELNPNGGYIEICYIELLKARYIKRKQNQISDFYLLSLKTHTQILISFQLLSIGN